MNLFKTLSDLYNDSKKYDKRSDVIAISGNLSNMFIDSAGRNILEECKGIEETLLYRPILDEFKRPIGYVTEVIKEDDIWRGLLFTSNNMIELGTDGDDLYCQSITLIRR